jgi:glycosyltransferase involved in cell wall biosynthesis
MDKQNITPKKLRSLWSSNSLWSNSGYGQQSLEIVPRIHNAGYPIAVSNFFGLQAGKIMVDGILQYPVINHTYGSDAMVLHGRDFQADVVFSLQDVWVLNPTDLQQVNRWIPWVPIDHDPVSQPVLQALKYAYRVITFAKHGQKQLADHGIASTYIPHTVNTNIFTPMNTPERKQAAGLAPDTYLIGMVAANKEDPPRKAFQEAIDAFKLFVEKVPSAMLYIHSNPDFPGGFQFKRYADTIGVGHKILFPDPYQATFNIDKAGMAKIYNSFDMLIAPSISEGFGIPIIEAQSCGVPVVTNNWTSMTELVVEGVTGYTCKVNYKRFSPQGSFMGVPDVPDLCEKMMAVYRADTDRMKKAARDHIVKNYDTDTIFKSHWLPYLAMLEKEIYGDPLQTEVKP